MKKPSLIIGKKQIILACLTLILGVAVYINYVLAQNESVDSLSADASANSEYGQAEFVNSEETADKTADKTAAKGNNEDYFAQARLEKTSSRDEAVETLQTIIGGGDLSNDEMVSKALEAVSMSKLVESEGNIEALIKSKGFKDCIAYLDGKTAKIVVKTDGLTTSDAAAIKDIILSEVSIQPENIRIFEVK